MDVALEEVLAGFERRHVVLEGLSSVRDVARELAGELERVDREVVVDAVLSSGA
jgi:hypothetical protein